MDEKIPYDPDHPPHMNIYQRINAVMHDVKYVQKDAQVSAGAGGSYKAVSHDMVVAILRDSMVQHGIVVRVEQLKGELLQQKAPKGEKGYTMHLYSGEYAVHFHNIDQPDDFLTETVNAHANDSGDKAPGKAMSYAVKYAMLKVFSLETGENEESRFADPYTKEQADNYHALIEREAAYEFYLFLSTLTTEAQTGLHNSFPDGQKSAGKKKANKLQQDGQKAFSETVEDLKGRLAKQDISALEITGEMSDMEKRFLMGRLTNFEVSTLSRMKEAAV